ncbi:MAG: hypothetical protein H7332_06620, partial [Bdellovibrionales bacterium]|nr:hypothetical protein [Ramlibacter sp.]
MQTATNLRDISQQPWNGFRTSQVDASPVRGMWKHTTLVTNAEGNRECFAIGPDGFVWSYETGDEGQGAGRLISTGLSGEIFGLGVTGAGLLVVLAVKGTQLSCVMETYDPEQRWSDAVTVSFAGASASMEVEKIITQTRGTNLFIGFVVRLPGTLDVMVRCLWEAVWAGQGPVLARAPVSLASGYAFWQDQL